MSCKGRVFLLAALATFAATAAAQEITLKIHHTLPPQSTAQSKFMAPWCEKIGKESKGKLKCQIFPSMQLGGAPTQLYDQAKDGVVDIIHTLPGYSGNRFPSVEAFELPFMNSSAEASSRALWDFVQQYAAAEFKDVKVLAFHVHGPGYIHTRTKQIRTLADFKGLKLRAPGRQTSKMLAAMGASPVSMPVPQVPEALNKGVIEGAVIPWEIVPAIKVQELVKFHTETDAKFPAFYSANFMFVMNQAKYDALPGDLKKVIDDNTGRELSASVGRMYREADAPGRAAAQARGNTFYAVPASELESWRRLAQPVYDAWISDLNAKGKDGRKLFNGARALIEKYNR